MRPEPSAPRTAVAASGPAPAGNHPSAPEVFGRFPKSSTGRSPRHTSESTRDITKRIETAHLRPQPWRKSSRAGCTDAWRMMRRRPRGTPVSTLEIGAGTLNHVPLEPRSQPYDIVEPFQRLFERSPHLSRVRNRFDDIAQVPWDLRFDRIISIAAFEHICNLPEVVARCGLLLHPRGCIRVAVPSEGTCLWRLAWGLTTGLEFRLRYRLAYGVLMRHEHVNTALEIRAIIKYFFDFTKTRYFGPTRRAFTLPVHDWKAGAP